MHACELCVCTHMHRSPHTHLHICMSMCPCMQVLAEATRKYQILELKLWRLFVVICCSVLVLGMELRSSARTSVSELLISLSSPTIATNNPFSFYSPCAEFMLTTVSLTPLHSSKDFVCTFQVGIRELTSSSNLIASCFCKGDGSVYNTVLSVLSNEVTLKHVRFFIL